MLLPSRYMTPLPPDFSSTEVSPSSSTSLKGCQSKIFTWWPIYLPKLGSALSPLLPPQAEKASSMAAAISTVKIFFMLRYLLILVGENHGGVSGV